jgi:hypothetical protein
MAPFCLPMPLIWAWEGQKVPFKGGKNEHTDRELV